MHGVLTDWEAAARRRLDEKAKPPGSLGRLEDLAATLCAIQRTARPIAAPAHLVLFAADHGVARAGVTLWPQTVSAAVARATAAGRSGCAVFARRAGAAVEVVDVGLNEPLDDAGVVNARVRPGARDMAREAALNVDEFEAALSAGRAAAQRALKKGAKILIAGDVGIGNTTASAALTAFLCGLDAADAVGEGAGANAATRARKREVVALAVRRARLIADDHGMPAAMASVSGLEVAAAAGFYAEAADAGVCVVLDGAVSGAAALVAERLRPGARRAMIAASLSPEPSHAHALSALGLSPYLDWGLRLGEGAAALLLLPMLAAACAMMTDMADLAELKA
ncbi:MAG: nicotinate-nucleotide--dimethylbenzimidazole phosphoribosyltransferase [Hyphomicrobiales bacterium]|nr:nicotinate-nucleotide--dimethylbenzimidazole phosphoribosyltransferase [Hyphomicrobiales bacterium]